MHLGIGDWANIVTWALLLKLLIFGDLGFRNARCLQALSTEVQKGTYDVTIHAGDIAYDMDMENGRVGDNFMNMIELIAATVPYQVAMGNHEAAHNFSHYSHRFNMYDQTSGQRQNAFYSFNLGLLHVVVFSSEFYEFTQYGTHQITTQLNWLRADLEAANRPESRKLRPWIITVSHRPLYCDEVRCLSSERTLRSALEELFFKNKVDIMFAGHVHKYQRSWPVYSNKVHNGSHADPYVNPTVPIQIITGAAGNHVIKW